MMDLESHFFALKAAWITRILNDDHHIWSLLPKNYIANVTYGIIQNMSFSDKNQLPQLSRIPDFYQDVVYGYCKANITQPISTKSELYTSSLWGNKLFTVNGHCLFSKTFIASGILQVKDVIDVNGYIKQNIYNILVNKKHYFRTMSLLIQALKPYKNLRYSTGTITINRNESMIDLKCKHFYTQIVQQKVLNSKQFKRWKDLDNECDLYKNKCSYQFEVKIAEFNYKLIQNLLPTADNLFRWKKIQTPKCIYCDNDIHNAKHLLVECPHNEIIWEVVSNTFGLEISWKTVVTGVNIEQDFNHVISLICYLIYKKFLCDRGNGNNVHIPIGDFVKREILFRMAIYSKKVCSDSVRTLLNNITMAL